MRFKTSTKRFGRERGSVKSEALKYWRNIHNKYSVYGDQRLQRKQAMAKKEKKRKKERVRLSSFCVLVFMMLFAAILLIEVFVIDEQQKGVIITEKRGSDLDSIGEFQEMIIDDKKLIRELEFDSYRREELSVKGKDSQNKGFFGKTVDETHLSGRLTGNVIQTLLRDRSDWLEKSQEPVVHYNASTPGQDAKWLPVCNYNHKFYVYSAYYDNRKGRIVRIIGATQTKKSERVWCKYWYSNSSTLLVNGAVKIIRENWNLKYSACFIACPLTLYSHGNEPIPCPESVSIVTDPNGNYTNKLKVLNMEPNKIPKNNFAVCVKPIHFHHNNVHQIVEFIELYRILGVDHFTFYNDTVGSNVECVLKTYIKERIVRLLPWKLNMVSQKEIRTEGLFAALNDCLYRYMYTYKYVLFVDFDEFISPHTNLTLQELVSFLKTKADEKKVGAISFQNAFFYLQWPDDPNSASLPPLVTLYKTRRRQKPHPHKQRSKYIAVNPFVVEAGNHFVWEFLPGHGVLNVPNDIAFLHHYRVCEFGGDGCVRSPRTTDMSMYRYKNLLVNAFGRKLNAVSELCDLHEILKIQRPWALYTNGV